MVEGFLGLGVLRDTYCWYIYGLAMLNSVRSIAHFVSLTIFNHLPPLPPFLPPSPFLFLFLPSSPPPFQKEKNTQILFCDFAIIKGQASGTSTRVVVGGIGIRVFERSF